MRASSPSGTTDDPSALCQQGYRGAAQRTGAELEERREEQQTGEERRRAGGGRTDCLPSNKRDYTLQHPVASTCL